MDDNTQITRGKKYSNTYKLYYENNKEKVTKKNLEWKHNNPTKFLFNSCRQRAKQDNIEFNITIEDLIIPERCPLLETAFLFGGRYAPSVDRVDNSKGYIKGNVRIISMLANRMKNCASEEELLLFSKNILKGI